ncbi:hypothetical protein B0H17DRAFT_1077889, partial [Mycena rosella]
MEAGRRCSAGVRACGAGAKARLRGRWRACIAASRERRCGLPARDDTGVRCALLDADAGGRRRRRGASSSGDEGL